MASIWKNDLPYKHANHSALKPSMMFTAANSRSHSLSSSVGISKVWSQNTRTCVDACACMYARAYMRTKEGKAAAARLEILVWENYGARRLHRIQMMSNACIVSELIPITHEVTCTCVFVVLAQVHAYTNRIQRMGTQIDTWATHSRKTCPKGLQHSVNPRHLRRAGCVPSEAHQA
jgi:hypothetical protein